MSLTVGLGHALDLVLLLDGVRVGAAAGGVDDLIGEALGDGLDVAEGGLTGAGGEQVDGLVHAAERGAVHGLAAHHTGGADAGGVLTGARVDDGVHEDLERVLIRGEVDDVQRVLDDAHGHHLLARVAALAHEGARHALHDRGERLTEALLLVAALGVRQVRGLLARDADVIDQGDVRDLEVIVGPLAKELDLVLLSHLGKGSSFALTKLLSLRG
mmetsp:Transcript_19572/g.59256  ORF Transcript_19572/g.59256 Transcript_19572/m.59256 type:complete len:215 (+) Transcript_19572:1073-1717(+)